MPQAIGFAIAGAVGATVSATAATVIGSVAIGVVSIGGQLIAAKLTRQPSQKPSERQQEVRLTISPRVRSYGRVRVSGTLWFLDTPASGTTDHLYTGLVFNHGRIAQIVRFHIDENEVTINAATGVMESAPYNFDANNRILYRLGLPTETEYSDLETIFGIPDMRGDGCATLLARMRDGSNAENHMNTFPGGGYPEYRVTIDATVCWDPRNPAHDREDETTWEFSENLVVVLLNYLIDPDGYGLSWDRIEPNLGEWIDQMHVCDEAVPLQNGGSASRYRIAAIFDLTERPTDIVARMLSCGDARLWQRSNGSIGVTVGRFSEPGVTIEDRDIIGYRIDHGVQDPLTAVVGIRASYMSPDHDFREREAEPWPDGVTVAALGEDRVAQLDLTWVPSRSQARRLMKREYLRQTAPWRGTIVTNLAGLKARDARYIRLVIEELDIDISVEVQRFTLDPQNMRCSIDFLAVDATIDEWTIAEEGSEQEFTGFDFVSQFGKTGTALDPITEAGALIGQTVIVCGAAATLAATPAGWELISSSGPTSSLAIAAWSRVIDGSETSATFLGASGALIATVMKGAPDPTFSDKNGQITTSEPSIQTKNAIGAPYAVIAFGACLANQADADWLKIANDDDDFDEEADRSDEEHAHSTGAALSGAVKVFVFTAEEAEDTLFAMMSDEGTNGLLSFIMEPGS